MRCPDCQQRLRVKYAYQVRGAKYHAPGVVRVYECRGCRKRFRAFEVWMQQHGELWQQWEQRRQDWIRERADLLAKVQRLEAVVRIGNDHRWQRIREHLIQALGEIY